MGKGGDEVRLPPHLHPRWLGSEGLSIFLVLLGRGGSHVTGPGNGETVAPARMSSPAPPSPPGPRDNRTGGTPRTWGSRLKPPSRTGSGATQGAGRSGGWRVGCDHGVGGRLLPLPPSLCFCQDAEFMF